MLLIVAYLILFGGYAQVRNIADEWLPWHNGEAWEEAVFGGSATRWMQAHTSGALENALINVAFILHAAWFMLPFVSAGLLLLVERRKVAECLTWALAVSYAGAIGYVLLPLTPPWMSEGIVRLAETRGTWDYTRVDNNPVAAFPSLHAALPLMLGLFFILRTRRARWFGWALSAYALLVGVSVVYMGEHWIVDVLAGYALAGAVAALLAHPRACAAWLALPGRPIQRCASLSDRLAGVKGEPPHAPREAPRPMRRAA
jgi:membrane-associated phospholipid phosphatase